MDVLISGSSGLLGTALREALGGTGHRPVRLVRPASDVDGDDHVRWDPAGGRIEADAVEGIDAVVHLAGEPLLGRWTARKQRRIRRSRVEGTRLLATTLAALQHPPAVLLSGSAIGYYGSRGEDVLTEESQPGQGFLAAVCRDWEAAALPAADAGIRVVHLRTGLVQSPEADLLKLQLLPFKLGLGGKIGSGRQWFSWISIRDHIGAMLHLLQHPDATGPVNLVAPEPVRQAEYARTLARVLGRPAFLTVPRPAIALVFGSTAADEMVAVSQRVVTRRLTDELGYTFAHPELEGALRDLLERPAA